MKILVVEDDFGISELLTEKLRDDGYEVEQAYSGKEGFSFISKNPPDLMLLDYSLSDMNCKELITNLKNSKIEVPPFVVSTGQGDERIAVELMKLGARDYVIKDTFLLDKITDIVNRLFETIGNEKKLYETIKRIEQLEFQTKTFNWQIDSAGLYTEISPVVEVVLGYRPEEIIGKYHFYDFHPKENKTKFIEESFLTMNRKENFIDIVNPAKNKNNEIVWILTNGIPILNKDGSLAGYQGTDMDITQRQKSAEALKVSEEKHRLLFETMVQGVVYQAADGNIISCNKAAERILGLTEDQMKGVKSIDPRWRSIHQDGSEYPGETHPSMMALKTGKEIRNQVMGVFNPLIEDYTYININAIPIFRNNETKPYQVYATFEDITEKKKAEDLLLESEEKFRNLTQNSAAGIFMIKDENFITVNPALLEMLGYSEVELLSMKFVELIHPDYRELVYKNAIARKNGEPVPNQYEIKVVDKNGESKSILLSAGVIHLKDGAINIGTIFDISDRKKAEEALRESEELWRTIIHTSPDGMIITSINGIIQFVSEQVLNIYRLEKREEAIGKHILEFVDEVDHDKAKWFIRELLHGNPTGVTEYCVKRKDESRFFAEINAEIIRDRNGNPISLFLVQRDITERKRILNELQQSNATKDKFFSIIAHDLKSPFNGILGLSELLMDEKEQFQPDILEMIRLINSSAKQIYRLLENLLDWARMQQGRVIFDPLKIIVTSEVDEVIELLREQSGLKQINLQNDIEPEISVFADKNMFKTIIRNLVSNAIKFTKEKGSIVLSAIEKNGFCEISVKDNGQGISKKNLERLFKLGENISTPGTENEHGTGLGLLLCKDFIEKHGGNISVESEVGVGSNFIFSLPIKEFEVN